MGGLNRAVLAAFGLGAAAGIVAGCQVYDFEPVVPLTLQQYSETTVVTATGLKPNLMLLVDKSGSMDLPADRTDADCYTALDGGICGTNKTNLCDTTVCPTRWSELQGAMEEFLTNSGDVARMGLAVYPTNAVCGAPDGGSKVFTPLNQSPDSDAAGRIATANEINTRLQGIQSAGTAGTDTSTGGGTPTGSSIRLLSGLAELQAEDGRDDFLLVLTDGLPNCNFDSTVDPTDEAACRCTGNCSSPTTGYLQCLDKEGTVAAIEAARERAIRTIVVGFGDETAGGNGPEVLNAMAEAGGFPRTCDEDMNGCAPGDTCSAPNGPCNTIKYYQATSRTELATQLAAIGGIINPEPCRFPVSLNPPNNDERLVVVYLTESGKLPQRLTAGPDTFQFTPGLVELVGATCTTVSNSTPQNPVAVEIRILSNL